MKDVANDDDGSTVQIISGAIIGVLATLAFVGIVYYFVKNPKKFRSLIVSMLRASIDHCAIALETLRICGCSQ